MSETDEYPEAGETIIGTVDKIFGQGAFIKLDEYGGKQGMLHISEISLKWVRNIRDYVKEGQKTVLQVLSASPKRGHIDLSLRRVSDSQRKIKLLEVKKLQRSTKLIDLVAKELETSADQLQEKLEDQLLEDYDNLYDAFEAIVVDNKIINKLELSDEERDKLLEFINKSISPPLVEITGYLQLSSTQSDGVEIIKATLNEMETRTPKTAKLKLTYVSAPTYRIQVTAGDYKSAEAIMKKTTDQGIKYIESHNGVGEFQRELEKK